MSDVGIPINAEDLPTEQPIVEDTSLVYPVTLSKIGTMKVDKNDRLFFGVNVVISDGDYEGMTLQKNYIKVPISVAPDATKRERIKAQTHNADFGAFARCFRMRGAVPTVASLADEAGRAAFMEYLEKYLEAPGKVTVENNEFPPGTGRIRSAVNNFFVS